MNPLITTLKSKAQTLLCIVLATLLTVSYLTGKSDREVLRQVSDKLTEHVQLNSRLSEQNLSLALEIKNKPKEYITITKDVERQVCDGRVQQELIKSLPSRKESVDEKNVADIDDHLPNDLLKLLK